MGIIFIVNLEIGYLTPPVGMNLFVSSTLFKRSLGWVIKAVLPTLGIMFLALVVITWVPTLSLGLIEILKASKDTPATATTPTEPPKVKSLDELMKESQGTGAGAPNDDGAGKVKSLQELMEEAKAKESGEAEPAPTGKVKSLQELMDEAKAKEGSGG
jgi:C4-dicarboxylate transporter DctM subunit